MVFLINCNEVLANTCYRENQQMFDMGFQQTMSNLLKLLKNVEVVTDDIFIMVG